MDLKEATIEELDAELDRRDALRLKGEAYNREETKGIMAIRNQKIAARELHARENPTPILGRPNQERLDALRVKAGVAVSGVKAK